MSFKKLFGENRVLRGNLQHDYVIATNATKEIGEYLLNAGYIPSENRPKSFKTGTRKYVVECELDRVIVTTYSLKTNKHLCTEYLTKIEVLFKKNVYKFIQCEVSRGKAKHGLFAKFEASYSGYSKNIKLNNENIPAYVITEKMYFWPFTKTETSKIVNADYRFAGYEYRIGKNHYYHVPMAKSAEQFAY